MSDIFTMIVGLLAAVGVTALIWALAGTLLRAEEAAPPIYAVLRADSGPADLQRTVRRIGWVRRWGLTDLRVVVAWESLPPETRAVIETLRREDPNLLFCEAGEVWECLCGR
jgi:hypothetical protein